MTAHDRVPAPPTRTGPRSIRVRHLGNGLYRLPSGLEVQGKEAACDAAVRELRGDNPAAPAPHDPAGSRQHGQP